MINVASQWKKKKAAAVVSVGDYVAKLIFHLLKIQKMFLDRSLNNDVTSKNKIRWTLV